MASHPPSNPAAVGPQDDQLPGYISRILRYVNSDEDILLDRRSWNQLRQELECADRKRDFVGPSGVLSVGRLSSDAQGRLAELRALQQKLGSQTPGSHNAYDNVLQYVSETTLPPMPWSFDATAYDRSTNGKKKGGKARAPQPLQSYEKNPMVTPQTAEESVAPVRRKRGAPTNRTPNDTRHLRNMSKIDSAAFSQQGHECEYRSHRQTWALLWALLTAFSSLAVSKHHLPTSVCQRKDGHQTVDIDTDDEPRKDYLTVPNPDYNIPRLPLPDPRDERGVQAWVTQLPCATITRLLHITNPFTSGWHLDTVGGRGSRGVQSDLIWYHPAHGDHPGRTQRGLVVEVKDSRKLDLLMYALTLAEL